MRVLSALRTARGASPRCPPPGADNRRVAGLTRRRGGAASRKLVEIPAVTERARRQLSQIDGLIFRKANLFTL